MFKLFEIAENPMNSNINIKPWSIHVFEITANQQNSRITNLFKARMIPLVIWPIELQQFERAKDLQMFC
jgi:hypothetical protein